VRHTIGSVAARVASGGRTAAVRGTTLEEEEVQYAAGGAFGLSDAVLDECCAAGALAPPDLLALLRKANPQRAAGSTLRVAVGALPAGPQRVEALALQAPDGGVFGWSALLAECLAAGKLAAPDLLALLRGGGPAELGRGPRVQQKALHDAVQNALHEAVGRVDLPEGARVTLHALVPNGGVLATLSPAQLAACLAARALVAPELVALLRRLNDPRALAVEGLLWRANPALAPSQVVPGGKPTMRGKSQFRGVSWYDDVAKWRADLRDGQKMLFLGTFTADTDAARAYGRVVLELKGADAKTNYPSSDYMSAERAALAGTLWRAGAPLRKRVAAEECDEWWWRWWLQ
jgi:hypothetical protein